jgi:hypothetical protein
MSPERDVAFLIGLMFKTLRWFKGLSRFAGLQLSGICSKGLKGSIPAYRQAGVQKVGSNSEQCLMKGTLRYEELFKGFGPIRSKG